MEYTFEEALDFLGNAGMLVTDPEECDGSKESKIEHYIAKKMEEGEIQSFDITCSEPIVLDEGLRYMVVEKQLLSHMEDTIWFMKKPLNDYIVDALK